MQVRRPRGAGSADSAAVSATSQARGNRGGAMKIRSRNNTLPNAWGSRAPAAPARKRHFGIREEVPPDLSAEVVCRAEAAQGPRVIDFSNHVCCPPLRFASQAVLRTSRQCASFD